MKTSAIDKIFVFGASITQSMWWTWKDYLEIESGLPIHDLAIRGVGNTYMTQSLIDQPLDEKSLVVGMLTNVDKFDWYVEDERYQRLQNEKHRPVPASPTSGFWCTGSWFPGEKEAYKEKYYSLDYFCCQSIQQILLMKQLSAITGCKIEIFFDSPIWDYTEQDINAMCLDKDRLPSRNLLSMPLSKKWTHLLTNKEIDIHDSSFIGFCWKNNLPWANEFYKGHPPSSSHWMYYKEIMTPRLNQHLDLTPARSLEQKISSMDEIWKNQ